MWYLTFRLVQYIAPLGYIMHVTCIIQLTIWIYVGACYVQVSFLYLHACIIYASCNIWIGTFSMHAACMLHAQNMHAKNLVLYKGVDRWGLRGLSPLRFLTKLSVVWERQNCKIGASAGVLNKSALIRFMHLTCTQSIVSWCVHCMWRRQPPPDIEKIIYLHPCYRLPFLKVLKLWIT